MGVNTTGGIPCGTISTTSRASTPHRHRVDQGLTKGCLGFGQFTERDVDQRKEWINEYGDDDITGVIYRRPKTDFKFSISKLVCILNTINKIGNSYRW